MRSDEKSREQAVLDSLDLNKIARPHTPEEIYVDSAAKRVAAIDAASEKGTLQSYRKGLLVELRQQLSDALPRLRDNGDDMHILTKPERSTVPYLDAWFIGASVASQGIVFGPEPPVDAYAMNEMGELIHYQAPGLGWTNIPEGPYRGITPIDLPTDALRQAVKIVPTLGWPKLDS